AVADLLATERRLLVRLVVHERVLVAVGVEERHRPVLDEDVLDLLGRVKRPLDDRARLQVAELGHHLRAATADLLVLVVDDLPEAAVHLDLGTAAQVCNADHRFPCPPTALARRAPSSRVYPTGGSFGPACENRGPRRASLASD